MDLNNFTETMKGMKGKIFSSNSKEKKLTKATSFGNLSEFNRTDNSLIKSKLEERAKVIWWEAETKKLNAELKEAKYELAKLEKKLKESKVREKITLQEKTAVEIKLQESNLEILKQQNKNKLNAERLNNNKQIKVVQLQHQIKELQQKKVNNSNFNNLVYFVLGFVGSLLIISLFNYYKDSSSKKAKNKRLKKL